jgi:hypothetical protein
MGIVAIASDRPKAGQEVAFQELLKKHIPTLRAQGLLTDAPAYASRSANGTILEVFEWKSQEAKDKAHENKAVMDCWNQFFGLAEIVALNSLEEAKAPFASFERIS